MRGKIVPVHCAAELPHGSYHSSPASLQSYFMPWLARYPLIITKIWLRMLSRNRFFRLAFAKDSQYNLFRDPAFIEPFLGEEAD